MQELEATSEADPALYKEKLAQLAKPSTAYTQPRHVHFQVSTETLSDTGKDFGKESCSVRLTTVKEVADGEQRIETTGNDVFFYRLGYFNYQKLNFIYTIQRYQGRKWYDVDIVIDWGPAALADAPEGKEKVKKQSVKVFVDGKRIRPEEGTIPFYQSETVGSSTSHDQLIPSANALLLYGLSPASQSRFRDVKVCVDLCDGGEVLDLKDGSLRRSLGAIVALLVIIQSVI